MRIEKLLIYGFGKHENVTIDLGSGMNVLYGLNEAGKTTIQQFILQTLFGFPQRNSVVLRYEPKSGGKYGGQIVLVDDTYGRCVVERVRGKSAGDVTVYFEDGREGGEEDLAVLLRHYNRASFESIFSFSLLQLQGIEKMDEEELSRTLLASGTTGVDSLLELEKQMEKEMGDLFKKSGRIPKMNVKIRELRELEIKLREEQERVAEYTPAMERIREIEAHLIVLREEENEKRERLQQLSKIRQYLPLYEKKDELESRLENLGPVKFPSDGIRRFESLAGKLAETKATKSRMKDELSELATRLPNLVQLEKISAIGLLVEKESEWVSWRAQVSTLEDELRRLHSLEQRLLSRLGVSNSDKTILYEADVSLRKEEEMHELINEMTALNNQISQLETQYEIVAKECLEVQSSLENKVEPTAKESKDAKEWPSIRQQLAEAKAFVLFEKKETVQNSQALRAMLLVIGLTMIGFGLIQRQWFIAIIGVIIGGIGLYIYPKKKSTNASEFEKKTDFIATYSGKEVEMEQLIMRIENDKRTKERFEQAIQALEVKKVKINVELETLAEQVFQVETIFAEFIQTYGFDGLPSPGIVPELFRMIRDVQEIARDIEDTEQRKHVTEKKVTARIAEVEKVIQQVVSPEAMYELLRRDYVLLKEEAETGKSVETRIKDLQPKLKETIALVDSLENDLQLLIKEANVEIEEEFYNAYERHQEMAKFEEQLLDIESQLRTSDVLDLLENQMDYELIEQTTKNERELVSLGEQSNRFMTEKAALVNKTERLLTDKTYGEQRQLFEMKKAELAALAKKWSARRAVSEAIRRTMLELQEEKLPNVLRQAEELFTELTAGKYEALAITEDGFFVAIASNGMRYSIAELSQATKEQVYISLRLALAKSVFESAPFPIVMDDPFVHFDEERLSRMIELLQVANYHQFIYFTCHKKMKNQWVDATNINV